MDTIKFLNYHLSTGISALILFSSKFVKGPELLIVTGNIVVSDAPLNTKVAVEIVLGINIFTPELKTNKNHPFSYSPPRCVRENPPLTYLMVIPLTTIDDDDITSYKPV